MDVSTLSISLPIAISLVGCFIGIMTYLGNRKKQNKDDEARLVRMETMLVNIEANTNNLKSRVDNHDKLLTNHEARIAVLENEVEK